MPALTITTFYDAATVFLRAPQAQQRANSIKVSNNTYLIRETDGDAVKSYALAFHGSKIIRYGADGSITLNHHGYQTATTKHRMNQFTPFSVYQRDGAWFVVIARVWEYSFAMPVDVPGDVRFVPADTVAGWMHIPLRIAD
jgi:hypothetical protein